MLEIAEGFACGAKYWEARYPDATANESGSA